jgi:phosphoribosylaminoimidazolecarboxamide formyltransferase/IMP cyclohydrolase
MDIKRVGSGLLMQTADNQELTLADLKVVTKKAADAEQLQDLLFAWTVAKYVKSNAIVFCKGGMTMGVGAGQMSRLDSARIASIKAGHAGLSLAARWWPATRSSRSVTGWMWWWTPARPASSSPAARMRDQEVIAAADERGVAMVFTGVRHFRTEPTGASKRLPDMPAPVTPPAALLNCYSALKMAARLPPSLRCRRRCARR